MSLLPHRCPRYDHAEMTETVIHDHEDDHGLRDCGVLLQCPACHFTEWAAMACTPERDEPDRAGESESAA
jgi:hypothetical protein